MAKRGDIVLARFPFTDGSGVKLRPVLVLVEIPRPYRDFSRPLHLVAKLNQAVPGLDVVLDPAQPAFRRSGLKAASVFRVSKIASLSEALIVGTLGRLEASVFSEIVRRLASLLETGRLPTPAT